MAGVGRVLCAQYRPAKKAALLEPDMSRSRRAALWLPGLFLAQSYRSDAVWLCAQGANAIRCRKLDGRKCAACAVEDKMNEDRLRQNLADLIARHCQQAKRPTLIDGLTLYCARKPAMPVQTVYNPRLCVVVQGAKNIGLDGHDYRVDAQNCLAVMVDLPVTAAITDASDDSPHYALSLEFDRSLLAAVFMEMAYSKPLGETQQKPGLARTPLDENILEPLVRLVSLLSKPEDIGFMAPLALRELYYRLLRGAQGPLLCQIAMQGSYLTRVGLATGWLREHYAEPVQIEELARLAGMGRTTFHRYFRAITSFTPLQYRTHLRLQEARRRLMTEGEDISTIAFAMGYDSPSQFTREYRKTYGTAPRQDRAEFRKRAGLDASADAVENRHENRALP
ncbi:AraC family transcriptional regulator CmrA [Thalassospira marina]|uniref:AraC family transcriptional regulator CmrA n=2 Tax=Thalassospira marina TaxID=2048283 RepID=A0A2N3KMF5_9PROT|nr:AraC family transcriptional regulator CmrA [Thalassospira marina]